MGRPKQFIAQVMNASTIVFEEKVRGRKAQSELLQRALKACSARDGGMIRSQTVGAKGWGYYLFDRKTREANRVLDVENVLKDQFEEALVSADVRAAREKEETHA